MKIKKYKNGGVKMTGGGSEAYYTGAGIQFLASAMAEARLSGRKGTSEDVVKVWDSVKRSNPKRAAEILQRAKQFRMESDRSEYGESTPRASGFLY